MDLFSSKTKLDDKLDSNIILILVVCVSLFASFQVNAGKKKGFWFTIVAVQIQKLLVDKMTLL